MKKIIFCLAALFVVFLASCSNDDIEVTQTGGLKINVSTQDVYDQFKSTSDIKDYIRQDGCYVRVMTFLYNKDGNLVDSKQEDIQQLNTVTFDFNNVPSGEYTALTIETVVYQNSKGEVQSPAWSFDDVDKLSTIKATQKLYEIYYPYVIGVSANSISVSENTELTVRPQGIGSILQLYYLNFDKSSYIDVGFATDDMIDYYSFNTSLERDSRFHTNLTSKGYTNVRCSKAIEKSNSIHQTRYVLEKSIGYDFCFTKNSTDSNKGTWTYWTSIHGNANLEDGKIYYGAANFIDDNKTLNTYFGDEAGFRSWYTSLSTSSSIVPPLYTTWKSGVSSVQSFMKDYTMTVGKSGQAEKQADGTYAIAYKGKGKEESISYSFTSATSGLFEIDVFYSQKTVTSTELKNYLNQNCTLLTSEGETYMYSSADGKSIVILYPYGENNEYWVVGYVDIDYLNSMSAPALHMPAQAKRLLQSRLK